MKTPILPPKLGARELFYLRSGGWCACGAAVLASFVWGGEHPWVNVLALAVVGLVGKWLGAPVEAVTRAMLARRPEQLLSIAAEALQKLTPEQAETATQDLLASLPPAAQARVGVVLLNTASSAPPAPPTPPAP